MRNIITAAVLGFVIITGSASAQDRAQQPAQEWTEPEPYWAEVARREARGEYDHMTGACMTKNCTFDFLILAAPIAGMIANAPAAVIVVAP